MNNNESKQQAFAGISQVRNEESKAKNALAFKHYSAEEVVAGKTMRDHLHIVLKFT